MQFSIGSLVTVLVVYFLPMFALLSALVLSGVVLKPLTPRKRFWRKVVLITCLIMVSLACIGAGVCFSYGVNQQLRRGTDADGFAPLMAFVGGGCCMLTALIAWLCVRALRKPHAP